MKPSIGSRSAYNRNHQQEEKPKTPTQYFVEINTRTNIIEKREFMYLVDVYRGMDIHTLETRIKLAKWLEKQLQTHSKKQLIEVLERMEENDRYRMQKLFKISI